MAANGDDEFGFADRVRQSSQFTAGARQRARDGDRGEAGHRRVALEIGAAASSGKPAARSSGGGAGGRVGAGAEPGTAGIYLDWQSSGVSRPEPGLARAGLYRSARGAHVPVVWTAAGVAGNLSIAGGSHARRRPKRNRRTGALQLTARVSGYASGA